MVNSQRKRTDTESRSQGRISCTPIQHARISSSQFLCLFFLFLLFLSLMHCLRLKQDDVTNKREHQHFELAGPAGFVQWPYCPVNNGNASTKLTLIMAFHEKSRKYLRTRSLKTDVLSFTDETAFRVFQDRPRFQQSHEATFTWSRVRGLTKEAPSKFPFLQSFPNPKMATRSLTDVFVLMRNNAMQNRYIFSEQVRTSCIFQFWLYHDFAIRMKWIAQCFEV